MRGLVILSTIVAATSICILRAGNADHVNSCGSSNGDTSEKYIEEEMLKILTADGYQGYQPSGKAAPPQKVPPTPPKPTCKQKSIFEIIIDVTLKLGKAIAEKSEKYESFTFSVFNILHVLYMITNGACAETLDQLVKYEEICNLSEVNAEFKKYLSQLNRNIIENGDVVERIRTYAALFVAKNFTLYDTYVNQMKGFFGADLTSLPFYNEPEVAQNTMNKFINNATYGFYPKYFSEPLERTTLLVLVATFYLRVIWEQRYFTETSDDQPFLQIFTDKYSMVRFLNNHQGVGAAGYAEIDNYKMVQIPTRSQNITLIAMYPQNMCEDPKTYMKSLTPAKISKIFKALDNMSSCKVNISFPECKVDSTYDLIDYLKEGGVTDLFTNANLCKAFKPSPQSNKPKVNILRQKASFAADRYGITAVAATVSGITPTAVQICEKPESLKQFYANRPFFFIIADKKKELILFSGCYYGPQNST